ncbi:hypothetical protein [Hymenobacter sp. BT730]|uniref:hypothetical protein n=1 Tax=Hymenobacter sp. BT730 TaxID=3063332 RepID=UPI0026DFD0F6|nr:hypothetical protein [Hymenobacter sp. BT730]
MLGTSVLVQAGEEKVFSGRNAQTGANGNPFFLNEKEQPFTLVLPLESVLKDRGDKPAFHAATILYQEEGGITKSLAVQVRVRGHRRKDPAVCEFPPLLIRFPRGAAQTSIFGPVEELKLTTHCLEDSYVLREYLVYKLYNVLTDMSFRARLCRVTYQDANGKRKATVHRAFLLEDAKAMAKRNQAVVVPSRLVIGMQYTNQEAMARVALFQYMIGNTDWSVPYRHNIRLLSVDQRAPCIPVPHDFDYSGLVMTPYATPPEQLGITSVRQRLFRGYNFPDELYTEMRTLFNARRPAFNNVYLSCDYLSKDEKMFAIRFLDEFYETLNNPKDFERSIVRVGRRNEKQYISIKGLD